MAERFYVNYPVIPGEVILQGPEAHHLATVMRAKPGDSVTLFTGDGLEYPATVAEVGKKAVTLQVLQPISLPRELAFELEIATAIPKGDRGDFLVEKLTELGVTRLVPLKTQRSVVHPRIERLERTVIEACKQCGRNRLMEIADVTAWGDYCQASLPNFTRLIAHPALLANTLAETSAPLPPRFGPLPPCGGGLGWGVEPSRASNPDPNPPPQGGRGPEIRGREQNQKRQQPIVIAIGPEGGFTDDEVQLALDHAWQPIDLGPRILRVETAAIALAAYYSLSLTNASTA
ncbi:MAG: RsmE family RNA methyltransferase [Gemmataceae bacterium]